MRATWTAGVAGVAILGRLVSHRQLGNWGGADGRSWPDSGKGEACTLPQLIQAVSYSCYLRIPEPPVQAHGKPVRALGSRPSDVLASRVKRAWGAPSARIWSAFWASALPMCSSTSNARIVRSRSGAGARIDCVIFSSSCSIRWCISSVSEVVRVLRKAGSAANAPQPDRRPACRGTSAAPQLRWR